jgi:hypothetical protein
MVIKAENFVEHTLQKRIVPCYSTWELLCKGYLKKKNIKNVLKYLKKALSSLKKWYPDMELLEQIFALIEENGDVEACEELLLILREEGYVTTELYNLVLRVYEKEGKMPLNIGERMGISVDKETKKLLKITTNCSISKVGSRY